MAKKDFTAATGSAASAFISQKRPQPEQEQPQEEYTEQPEQQAIYRKQDVKLEIKDRRLQVLMYPSVYNELKRRADAARTADGKKVSVNDYLNNVLIELFKEDV